MTWGGSYATAAAVIAQTLEFVLKWLADIAAVIIILDAARDIVELAKEDYENATDKLTDINMCREQLLCAVQNHRLAVTVPFQRSAIQTALGRGVIGPNYGGMCSFYQNLAIRSISSARSASAEYGKLFCVSTSTARRELDYFGGIAGVDASYARARNQERRQELLREVKVSAVQGAHAGSFRDVSGVFGLIDSAAQIYGYIQAEAAGALGGVVASLGYGATTVGTAINTSIAGGASTEDSTAARGTQ